VVVVDVVVEVVVVHSPLAHFPDPPPLAVHAVPSRFLSAFESQYQSSVYWHHVWWHSGVWPAQKLP